MSTCTIDFVIRAVKKLQVGFGFFKNCYYIFSTQGAFFGSKCFDNTHGVQLPCQMKLQVIPPRWLAGEGFVF